MIRVALTLAAGIAAIWLSLWLHREVHPCIETTALPWLKCEADQ